MAKSNSSSILKRIITALVLVPVTIGVLYSGFPYVQILALLVGGMMAWEWANMVPNKGTSVYPISYAISVSAAIMFPSFIGTAIVILGSALLVWIKAKDEKRRNLLTLGVFYISLGIGSIVWLYAQVGFLDTLWFLLMVWGVDTGGYVVGCNLKGPKLAPKISPNKTWSGLIGGVMLSVLVSIAYSYAFTEHLHVIFYAVLGGIVAVIAQIGDLVESYIKRNLGIKDSSNLIPGHGGVFDRVDGLIFAAPLVFLLFKFGVSFIN